MLTCYDSSTAPIFEASGVKVLLVGDSAANTVFGHDSTVPVTLDELLPLAAGVVRSTDTALVVGDLPFGSYQLSPAQALESSLRYLKEAGVGAVKLEGGQRVRAQIELVVNAGIPVMAHIGLTPQSVHALGGHRVQGRGDAGTRLIEDALSVQEAGAFAVVVEVIPADLARRIQEKLDIPVIGIGAGPHCDAQVLVWQDMAGLTSGKSPKFVKRFGNLDEQLAAAAQRFTDEVRSGEYPSSEHCYE